MKRTKKNIIKLKKRIDWKKWKEKNKDCASFKNNSNFPAAVVAVAGLNDRKQVRLVYSPVRLSNNCIVLIQLHLFISACFSYLGLIKCIYNIIIPLTPGYFLVENLIIADNSTIHRLVKFPF